MWRSLVEEPLVVAARALAPATVGVIPGLVRQYRLVVIGEDDLASLGVSATHARIGVVVHGFAA